MCPYTSFRNMFGGGRGRRGRRFHRSVDERPLVALQLGRDGFDVLGSQPAAYMGAGDFAGDEAGG